MDRAQELIERLGLIPHPERGHYVETYRAALAVGGLPHGGARAAPGCTDDVAPIAGTEIDDVVLWRDCRDIEHSLHH